MKEITKNHSLDISTIENPYLFGERLEQKLMKIASGKQNSKSVFTGFQKRKPTFSSRSSNQPFLSDTLLCIKQGNASGAGQCFLFLRAAVRGKNLPRSFSSAKSKNSQSRNTLTHTCSQKFVFYQGSAIVSLAICCQYFFENWKKLTNDPSIFDLVRGYQIPFLSEPYQGFSTRFNSISSNKSVSVDQEIETM